MPLDLDFELRLAVFDHVKGLAEAGGGRITAEELSKGLTFRGARVPIWNYQKGIFRPAILRSFGAALSIQTSFDSPYDDYDDQRRDRLVYRYRGSNPNHADNIALRRAMELGRPLLYLIAVEPGVYEPVFPATVVAERHEDLAFELVTDVLGRIPVPDEDPLINIGLKAYATKVVKTRLHQARFRYAVLQAYQRRCAMCRLGHIMLLDAAHILPDREERSLPEVPNGMALCRIHHGAYDFGMLGVDPDYRIHIKKDVLNEKDGPMLRHGLQELHGAKIVTPRRAELKPRSDFLAIRFEQFRVA